MTSIEAPVAFCATSSNRDESKLRGSGASTSAFAFVFVAAAIGCAAFAEADSPAPKENIVRPKVERRGQLPIQVLKKPGGCP